MNDLSTAIEKNADADPVARVRAGYAARFGESPAVVIAAPGRVNLIGEHTDYNGGFVLPCAIDFTTAVAMAPCCDGIFTVLALDEDHAEESFRSAGVILPHEKGEWSDYVRGAVEILRVKGCVLHGANIVIAGNVPQGAGLSSSASLTVALVTAFHKLGAEDDVGPKDIAVLARAVETDFVGVQCGIMDQMISACGEAGHALLIDCRSLETTPVALHPDLAVMIVHSGVSRELKDSAYNARRADCDRAARYFGAAALRDVTPAMLDDARDQPDPVAWRRARHVVSENERVLQAIEALREGDLPEIRRLLQASHASMRDDFEITTPEIDELVEITQAAIGDRGGARMTGGGFGGCIVAVAHRSVIDAARAAVIREYRTPDGHEPRVFMTQPSQGAMRV